MKLRRAVSGASLAAPLIVVSAGAAEICDRTFDDPQHLLQDVRSDPRYEATAGTELYLAFVDRLEMRIWAFTTPANPAHPAVICRTVAQQEEAWVLNSRILCGGPKPACDSMAADFEELDKQMADSLEARRDEAQE